MDKINYGIGGVSTANPQIPIADATPKDLVFRRLEQLASIAAELRALTGQTSDILAGGEPENTKAQGGIRAAPPQGIFVDILHHLDNLNDALMASVYHARRSRNTL